MRESPSKWYAEAAMAIGIVLLITQLPTGDSSPPALPPNEGNRMIVLSTPSLEPGGTGTLSAMLSNPFSVEIASLKVTFQLYGWAGSDGSFGNLTPLDTWAPSLSINGTAGGMVAGRSLVNIGPGTSVPIAVRIDVPSGCPAGSYFVRDAVNVTLSNGTAYVLLSRGYFSNVLWQKATLAANGTPMLNLALLNVSGVLPETAIPVVSTGLTPWIWGILGAALLMGGIGGYLWTRTYRASPSTSGARPRFFRKKAENALGKRRIRTGD